jgi:hypothetical protein
MNKYLVGIAGVLLVFGLIGSSADAAVISGNWCSVAPIMDFPAGVVPVGNWNDLTGPAGFAPTDSTSAVIYDDGSSAVGTTIAWSTSDGGSQNTNDYVIRPLPPATTGNHIQDGHDQMMTGYLQASKHSTASPLITLNVTGVNLQAFDGSYDVIVYFDGDDDVQSDTSRAQFRIYDSKATYDGGGVPLVTYYGRDSVGSNFGVDHTVPGSLADYTQITSSDEFSPTEGNYVRFSGLEDSDFFVTISGVAGQQGVALNGFQIVPEPATMGLLALGSLGLLARRRRRTT